MIEPGEDRGLPDSEWWKAFREALLEGDPSLKVGGIDAAALTDGLRAAVNEWLDAGPGREIERRLDSIEARLDAIEASPGGTGGDPAAG